ncbi:ARPP-1 family domain-containing protein [Vibrio harveyi]|uniref:ARPP-1 family domain-containing protein n=1 Tax=Vibrio harveyi TaxID=669 RepID=UPI003CF3508D
MSQVTITDLLRGCSLGRMQTSGIMQVLPLVSEIHDERFVSPVSAGTVWTNNYGEMEFRNQSDKTMLIPSNATYIVNQKAQDHAMATAGLVGKNTRKNYVNAMCVQETQGNYISEGNHEMTLLPYSLREAAFERRNLNHSCGKIWSDIAGLLRETNSGHGGHLHHFMDAFEKELDQFVAEFECVTNQVGAIILINGVVVGIERTPSASYFKDVWQPLIRECYGSEAIRVQRSNPVKERLTSDVRKATSLLDLRQALDEARAQDEEDAKGIVRNLLQAPFSTVEEGSSEGVDLLGVSHDQFVGQVVKDGAQAVYVSIISTHSWNKNTKWRKADAFTL